MKTIDERADLYCREHAYQGGYDLEDVRTAHIYGAEAEHDLLTRWRHPKEIVANHKWAVLVKLTPSIYGVASYSTEMERWIFVNYSLDREEIIGWREIHE